MLLVARDAKTRYFDCIPLAWLPTEPTPGVEKKAQIWLAQDQPAAAVLLGASHLLSTGRRPAAVEQLKRLSLDRDVRIALLAQAQLWRTTAFNVTAEQLSAWRRTLDKIPDSLRAGPDFIVGSALAAKQPEQAAVLLAAVAVLYPRERQLAAAGLLRAGELLEKLDRKPEATVLYRELWLEYPDRPEAAEARRRLGAAPAGSARVADTAGYGSPEERLTAGLRQRGLFALSEAYCRDRLADTELGEIARAELAIELARTLADHALSLGPEAREPVWREAAQTIDEFVRQRGQNPRVLLVRMQGALVALAAAESMRKRGKPRPEPAQPPSRCSPPCAGRSPSSNS